MTAGFNIAAPVEADRRPIPMPALTHLGIYDLARLFNTDRELALALAEENGRANQPKSGTPK